MQSSGESPIAVTVALASSPGEDPVRPTNFTMNFGCWPEAAGVSALKSISRTPLASVIGISVQLEIGWPVSVVTVKVADVYLAEVGPVRLNFRQAATAFVPSQPSLGTMTEASNVTSAGKEVQELLPVVASQVLICVW